MMTISFQKPTADEAYAYDRHDPPPCYPLYRWAWIDNPCGDGRIRLPVENCAGCYAGPRVEIIAPTGWQFDGLHSLLAHTLSELKERISVNPLTRCRPGCDCCWEEYDDES